MWQVGASLHCGAWASQCGGSFCGARALGAWASVVAGRGLSSCSMWALEPAGFSSCGAWAQWLQCTGSRVRGLQQLWVAGFVAPWRVGSSQTRARTCVPCIGRQILNHCTTREALSLYFYRIHSFGPRVRIK